MRRLGMFNTFIVLCVIICFTSVASAASSGEPVVQPSGDNTCIPVDTVNLCLGETIYDTLIYNFDGQIDSYVSMALLSGPGVLTYDVSDALYGYYTYTPANDGNFIIEYLVVGPGADSSYHQIKYIY